RLLHWRGARRRLHFRTSSTFPQIGSAVGRRFFRLAIGKPLRARLAPILARPLVARLNRAGGGPHFHGYGSALALEDHGPARCAAMRLATRFAMTTRLPPIKVAR